MLYTKYILFALLLLLKGMEGYGQPYVSKNSGAWNDANTWTLPWPTAPVPPGSGQTVIISTTHTVSGTPSSAYTLNVQGTLIFEGDYTNNSGGITIADGGTMLIKGNMTSSSGITINGAGRLLVLGNLTQTGGTITINNSGILVVGQNFTEGWQVVNAYNSSTILVISNYTVSGNLNAGASTLIAVLGGVTGSGCSSCTNTISTSNPAWVFYTQNLPTGWWENHLANIGESEGPTIVCPSSSSSFELTAVDDGNLAANTFEWAVYGGTITGADNTATIDGHTASAKTTTGVDPNNKSAIAITWESTPFAGAYVAVRQTSANDCSDGKWSIFYVNIQNVAAPTGSNSQSFCTSLNPTVTNLEATGASIKWYSNSTGGTALAAGTSLATGNYYASQTLNGCESDTRLAVAVTIISDGSWTGAIDNDWNNPGNWACNQIPSITTNVLIANGKPHYPTVSTGTEDKANNLTIDSGALLTVTGNTLQIAGAITNNGTFTAIAGTIEMKGTTLQTIGGGVFAGNTIRNLTINNSAGVSLSGALNVTGIVLAQTGNLSSGGNLTLISTAAQTALIDGAGSGNVTGNVTMQRYLASAFGYKYFSSPFSDATVAAFSTYLSATATIPTFYSYDEENRRDSAGVWAYQSGWVNYLAGTLSPMYGYAANFGSNTPEKTVSISGSVNNGSLSLSLYNHNRKYTKGFNLVGNPYPSPIDWDIAGWTKINVDNALYFFNAGNTDQYTGAYSSYVNGVKTGNADNNIASMQGFFVHVADGVYPISGTLGFTNSVRTKNLDPLFKAAIIDNRTILRFAANFETKNAIEDAAVIYFDDKASLHFEQDMDALKMTNTDILVPNLYTISTDPEQLSINGMPSPADSITKIPLGITTLSDGWINFKAKDISKLPADMHLYLIDAIGNITQDLKQYPTYRFYLKTGEYNQRFTLVFSLSDMNKPAEIVEKMFTIIHSGDRLYAKINLPFNTKGDLFLTNMQGQTLLKKGVFEIETVEINPNVGSGVYIVTMVSGKRTQSEKILIRKDYE